MGRRAKSAGLAGVANMKKSLIIVCGATLVILAGAAFVVGGMAGGKPPEVDWKSRRGTDAYYTSELVHFELKDIHVNLKGTDAQRYLAVGVGISYKVGPEIHDAKAPFATAEPELKDRLIMLLSNKTLADIEGLENKKLIKHEILEQVQLTVFPQKLGRVEEVNFNKFLIQ